MMTPDEQRQAAIAVETIDFTFLGGLVFVGLAYWLKCFIYENSNIKSRTLNWIFLFVFIAIGLIVTFFAYRLAVLDVK